MSKRQSDQLSMFWSVYCAILLAAATLYAVAIVLGGWFK